MGNRYWIVRRALISAVCLFSFLLLSTGNALAQQYPELPQLALVKSDFRTAKTTLGTYYPDGRMWVPRAPDNADREILVPVLVKNAWQTTAFGEAEPIRSFKFKVQYDDRALRFLSVQKLPPVILPDVEVLSKDFKIEASDAKDVTYKRSIDATHPADPNGRRVQIVGTSTKALPLTPGIGIQRDFVELVYIRFQVLATKGGLGDNQPIIISNDTLNWNDRDVKKVQFTGTPAPPPPGQYAGLHGILNTGREPNNSLEPTRPGIIYLKATDIPKIEFAPNTGGGAVVRPIPNTGDAQWEIIEPLTLDSASTNPPVAQREVDLVNPISLSRLTNITLVSDQPWLKFKTKAQQGYKNPIATETRNGFIDFIDNGILSPTNSDPLGDLLGQNDDGLPVRLVVIADPRALPAASPAGTYVGYITVYSPDAQVTPVRLRVTFILFRNPMEPNVTPDVTKQDKGTGTGIRLTVENSNSTGVQRTTMIFGAGADATDGIDGLFGEAAYGAPLSGFGARWYPNDNLIPNGMLDKANRSASRDIRNANVDSAIVYLCKFNAGGDENYPIVISWDTQDFPVGSQLFLRDAVNGTLFSTDMRNSTNIGGTRQAFTIRDARIKSFVIEYTLPQVIKFPELKKGWNLISLPVRPGNPFYKNVYVNALEQPLYFASNSYLPEANGMLMFGRGYFVKYGQVLDTYLAGVRITSISSTTNPVRVEEGWNTIGALSLPVGVDKIQFDPYQSQPLPQRIGGVYGYTTDRGYNEVSTLVPGFGYWMKVKSVGYFKVKSNRSNGTFDSVRELALQNSRKLSIRDNGQREGELYFSSADMGLEMSRFDLPPVPPAGMFDVRFNSGRYIETMSNPVVEVRGAEYPVVLTMENADANYTVVNAVTGKVLGSFEKGKTSFVTVNDARTQAVKLMMSGVAGFSYNLEVTAENTVRFEVPQTENVTISLVNSLGQEVASKTGTFSAGVHSFNFDANASGMYFVKMTAGEFTTTAKMVIVK